LDGFPTTNDEPPVFPSILPAFDHFEPFENANEEKGGLLREPAERLSKAGAYQAIPLPSDHEQWSKRLNPGS